MNDKTSKLVFSTLNENGNPTFFRLNWIIDPIWLSNNFGSSVYLFSVNVLLLEVVISLTHKKMRFLASKIVCYGKFLLLFLHDFSSFKAWVYAWVNPIKILCNKLDCIVIRKVLLLNALAYLKCIKNDVAFIVSSPGSFFRLNVLVIY